MITGVNNLGRTFFLLDEIRDHFKLSESALASHVYDNTLRTSVMVSGVEVEFGDFIEQEDHSIKRVVKGTTKLFGPMGLWGPDIWPVFCGESQFPVLDIRTTTDYFAHVIFPEDGYMVKRHKLVVLEEDKIRFEDFLLSCGETNSPVSRRTNYDWEGMLGHALYYILQNGWPERQSTLISHCLDWFANANKEQPDESSVKRKISRLYRNRPVVTS